MPFLTCFTGADLKERACMTEKEVSQFVPLLRKFTKRIYDVPIPVIAAIDGVALGKVHT